MWLVVLVGAVLIFGVSMLILLNPTTRVETEDCGRELISVDSIPSGRWEALGRKNVFFGHQSVGQNVVVGLSEILDENPEIKLNIVESIEFNGMASGNFFHGKVGQNTRPLSKIESFSEIITTNEGKNIDIALIKFCYVDLMAQSDPVELFDAYTTAMETLRQRIPEIVFIHVTIPIESVPRGAKNMIKEGVKKALRRPGVNERNLVRHRYNEMLRSTYEGKEPIFDIARLESTNPEGCTVFRAVGSEKAPFMDARFTADGGHLNKLARKRIAEQLLIVLANVANQGESPAS
jgi:hypothetical protein